MTAILPIPFTGQPLAIQVCKLQKRLKKAIRETTMQTRDRPLAIGNPTLNTLIVELGSECQTVLALLNQLQLTTPNPTQQANILADLLAASIHLHMHCGDNFQTLIADELEALPDTDEPDEDEPEANETNHA